MKKRMAKLSALLLTLNAALGMGLSAYADEHTDLGFAQCTEYVNIRSGANTDSDVVGKIYHNGKMEILDTTEDGWYHVRSGNVEGYISADYVATGEAAQEIAKTAGFTTAEVGAISLNIRQDMTDESDVLGAAAEGDKLEVVQNDGDWIKVVTNDGVYGYVSSQYVYTSTEYSTAETLEEEQDRLDRQWLAYLSRQDAEQAASSAEDAQAAADAAQAEADAQYQAYLDAQAQADEQVAQTEYVEDTSAETAIDTSAQDAADAQYQAYLDAQAQADSAAQAATSAADAAAAVTETEAAQPEYVEPEYTETEAPVQEVVEDTPSAPAASATGQSVANYATQFVGNPYVYGGSSLTGGADCSGFVMAVYANFGVSLPHYSGSQMGYGSAVDASSLAAGDLVFYGAGGSQHVAIYIGGGSIVHAANASTGIVITDINWPGTPTGYRRIV